MDVSKIFTQDSMFEFWPSNKQSGIQRVYATCRFIIYGTLIAFALKRNVKILVLGTVLLIGLYLYARQYVTVTSEEQLCTTSEEDPFGNLQYTKCYIPSRTRRWARDVFSNDKRNAERNFFTMPTNDLDSFLEYVHGGKDKPFCRQDQSMCIADTNPMFMDDPQRRTLNGSKIIL